MGTPALLLRLPVEGECEMPSAEEYRRRAGECLEAAAEATTPKTQAFLRRVAEAWWRLAEQVEHNKSIEATLNATKTASKGSQDTSDDARPPPKTAGRTDQT